MTIRRLFFGGTIFTASVLLVMIYFQEAFYADSLVQEGVRSGLKAYSNRELKDNVQPLDGSIERFLRKNSSFIRTTNIEIRDKKQPGYKLVLFYTPLFDRIPWKGFDSSYNLTHFRGKSCDVTNCRLTYDKNDLARSDAVIFHGRDMPSVDHLKEISRHRNWRQRWVYFIHENPYFTYYDATIYNNFFNWTMSYRRDSDFFVPYNYYRPLNSAEKRMQEGQHRKNYAQGKDKMAAWSVSHCGLLREKVVKKLIEYNVDVTVFGGCAHNFNQSNSCSRSSPACNNLLKRFKFYLAFENANCIDYVTEKYWFTPFLSDMVPVVLGPPKYDSKIAIPGSYINVMDFPSVKDLADYLKYLDKNDTAYNMYFEWKEKFTLDYPNPWNCKMCADLNNPNLPVKVYDDLGTYWGGNSSCKRYEDNVYKLLQT